MKLEITAVRLQHKQEPESDLNTQASTLTEPLLVDPAFEIFYINNLLDIAFTNLD